VLTYSVIAVVLVIITAHSHAGWRTNTDLEKLATSLYRVRGATCISMSWIV